MSFNQASVEFFLCTRHSGVTWRGVGASFFFKVHGLKEED